MTVHYLSRPQVAARIGVKHDTVKGYPLPEPDATVGGLPGWLPETIDAWQATRPGRGGKWDKTTKQIGRTANNV